VDGKAMVAQPVRDRIDIRLSAVVSVYTNWKTDIARSFVKADLSVCSERARWPENASRILRIDTWNSQGVKGEATMASRTGWQ
jgi:hypothetical protein